MLVGFCWLHLLLSAFDILLSVFFLVPNDLVLLGLALLGPLHVHAFFSHLLVLVAFGNLLVVSLAYLPQVFVSVLVPGRLFPSVLQGEVFPGAPFG